MKKQIPAISLGEQILRKLLVISALALSCGVAQADVGVMIGIAIKLDGNMSSDNFGLTTKLLSTDRGDHWVGGVGATYYPTAKDKFGLDISVGRNFTDSGVLFGYDLILGKPQVSGGWSNTQDSKNIGSGSSGIGSGSSGDGGDLIESDIRLKRDIRRVSTLKNGLKIYSFKYKSRDGAFVGVMAQDLLANPKWSKAVIQREDGNYLVNYRALGLRMATLENWKKSGNSAIFRNL